MALRAAVVPRRLVFLLFDRGTTKQGGKLFRPRGGGSLAAGFSEPGERLIDCLQQTLAFATRHRMSPDRQRLIYTAVHRRLTTGMVAGSVTG